MKRYRWWHGILFYAGVQIVEIVLKRCASAISKTPLAQSGKDDRAFYEAERLPVFAPPGAAFPIAWGINSISLIAGGLHVLNLRPGTKGRAQFLTYQTASWVLFSLFNAAYFGLRSPINAAGVTFAYTATTLASFDVTLRKLHDPIAAWSLATTIAWLALANPVSVAQATWNHDPFWQIGPLASPPRGWSKEAAHRKVS